MMTARPPIIPRMLKVAPTAALLLKKPEDAPTVGLGPTEMVEPRALVLTGPRKVSVLTNVVVGPVGMWDVTPTVELACVEDAWAFKEGDDDGEGVGDGEAEAALVAGSDDAA